MHGFMDVTHEVREIFQRKPVLLPQFEEGESEIQVQINVLRPNLVKYGPPIVAVAHLPKTPNKFRIFFHIIQAGSKRWLKSEVFL
jgi:hypothetical protein